MIFEASVVQLALDGSATNGSARSSHVFFLILPAGPPRIVNRCQLNLYRTKRLMSQDGCLGMVSITLTFRTNLLTLLI